MLSIALDNSVGSATPRGRPRALAKDFSCVLVDLPRQLYIGCLFVIDVSGNRTCYVFDEMAGAAIS